MIIDFLAPSILNNEDQFRWKASRDGDFTTKSAFKTIHGDNEATANPIFKCIWKWKGTERIRTFLWKLGHESLMTNMERQRRMRASSATCPNLQ